MWYQEYLPESSLWCISFYCSNYHWSPIISLNFSPGTRDDNNLFLSLFTYASITTLLIVFQNAPNPQFITFVSYSKLVLYFCLNTLYVTVFIHVITDYNYLKGRECVCQHFHLCAKISDLLSRNKYSKRSLIDICDIHSFLYK